MVLELFSLPLLVMVSVNPSGIVTSPEAVTPVSTVQVVASVQVPFKSEQKEGVASTSVTVSVSEVAGVNEVGVKVRVNSPAAAVMTRSVKVAIPATAATVVVPLSSPVPVAIDATTSTVELVTVLPLASMMRMTGWVARGDPLVAPIG